MCQDHQKNMRSRLLMYQDHIEATYIESRDLMKLYEESGSYIIRFKSTQDSFFISRVFISQTVLSP